MARRRAWRTIGAALALDLLAAVLFSAFEKVSMLKAIYWALATCTTVGYGDVVPHATVGYLLAIAVFLVDIPLFAAAISFFTASITEGHIGSLHDKVNHIIRHHPSIPDWKEDNG